MANADRGEVSYCQRLEARATAELAALRYVDDGVAGYERRRWGRGFTYRDWRGQVVRDRELRAYFVGLAIPPAWTEVWICRYRDGHLLVTGRDDAGRKQYIYHPRWREARDQVKYQRVLGFGHVLGTIRRTVRRHLQREGLGRERVLAAVVHLLDASLARVGNDTYAQDNDSYGLTTIRKRHVIDGDPPVLEFNGKGGKPWSVEVTDVRVAETVRQCLAVPGWELFKYFDADGQKLDVTSDDVNAYLQEISGADITAKDFRTWAGTVLAYRELVELDPDEVSRDPVVVAAEVVAEELGNTPAVTREAYIHPQVIEGYRAGELGSSRLSGGRELDEHESALLGYLEQVELCEAA